MHSTINLPLLALKEKIVQNVKINNILELISSCIKSKSFNPLSYCKGILINHISVCMKVQWKEKKMQK